MLIKNEGGKVCWATHRVTAEGSDIVLDPLDAEDEVLKTLIASQAGISQTEPSQWSKTVRDRNHDSVIGQVAAAIERIGCAAASP